MDALTDRSSLIVRAPSALDRIESLYLRVLRAALLIVATLLLACAVVWAGFNLTKVLRSPDSVVEKPSLVGSSEIIDQEAPVKAEAHGVPNQQSTLRAERAFYDSFVKRYHELFRTKYEPNQRAGDKKLTLGEFDDLTIATSSRLDAVRRGDLNFAQDKKDLEAFLPVVTEATATQQTADRLARYRSAVKRPIPTQVQRSRTELRRGWDMYSEACENWFEAPIGCPATRRVEVPYTETVNILRYPDGIASPRDVLKGYQDRYFQLLAERRDQNVRAAAEERDAIASGQVAGWSGLWQSVAIAAAFLVLMFFFLLVAIERHQRRQTASLN